MAIIAVDELRKSRTGGLDSQWHHTYRRAWRVTTEGPYDIGPLGARSAIPVFFGEAYNLRTPAGVLVEFDNFAFANKAEAAIDPDCNDDCSWIVTVDYGPWDPQTFPENPLQHPIKISWGETRFDKTIFLDINGNPVVNSAGDYFDPPVTIDDGRPSLRIVRNEPYYDPVYAQNWKDTLNADAFMGFPPHFWKLSTPLGELEYNPVCGFYYVVTYQFEANPDLWQKQILDQGMRRIAGGAQVNILDSTGAQISSPALLDGFGNPVGSGGSPYALAFDLYNEADYSLLGFDIFGAPGQGL